MKTIGKWINTILVGATAIAFSLAAASGFAAGQTVIVDNSDAGYSDASSDGGAWITGTGASGKYGDNYRFAHSTGSTAVTTGTATWRPDLPYTGDYNVYAWWTTGGNRSPDAPYTMTGPNGSTTVRVNQQADGGQWNYLGRHYFEAGNDGTVTLTNNAGTIVVMADAVKFEYASEYRAFWASRFEWPSANPSTAQSNLTAIMDTAETNNYNTVLLQVRGQMDVHYPSPYEPWSNTYNWTDPGWDPLQYAIDLARARNLELHAYFNTHTLASPIPPAVTTPQHVYNLHGPGAPPGADNWTIHDTNGNPQTSTNSGFSNYYWLSPGVPEASWWTRRAAVHLAQTYDIDGLHFDRIRTPGPGYSYDPISVARFNGDGNPDDLDWGDFMRSQFTRDLQMIYAEVYYWNKKVKISSSPIGISKRDSNSGYQGWGNAAQYNYYQDTYGWLQAGAHDFAVPQMYWEMGSNHAYETLLADWLANAGDRFIVGGSRTGKTIASEGLKPIAGLLAEQMETRNQNAAGHCAFSYTSLDNIPPDDTIDYFTGFGTNNYDEPTTTPDLPWRTCPTQGMIMGYIVDELGNPVLDARVNLEGDSGNHLSAFDGFFAILNIDPTTNHSLTASKLGYGSVNQESIAVTAGEVTSLTLTLEGSRGFVDFDKPRYNIADLATIRAYDTDLTGSGTTQVFITSTSEASGETVILTETAEPGWFEGTIQFQETASTMGDGLLRTGTNGTVTVTWTDADDGTGNAAQPTDTATVIWPEDIIIESRRANGTVTPAPMYQEFIPVSGSWSNTGNVGTPSVVIKSVAPGLEGLGGRYTGTGSVGAYALFTPEIEAPGYYNVYITLPDGTTGVDNHSPGAGYQIVHDGGTRSGTFNLSHQTAGMADGWYLLDSMVLFEKGTAGTIRITNNNASSANSSQRFTMDGVKLVFVEAVPVALSGFSME